MRDAVSAEAEIRQNDADDDNQADDVNDGIHAVLMSGVGRAGWLAGEPQVFADTGFNPVGDASQISSDKAGSDGHQGYGPMSFEPFALSLSKGQGKGQGER